MAEGTLRGIRVSGLQTRWARTLVTRPVVRTWMRFASPTHHGLPSLQPSVRRSAERVSGQLQGPDGSGEVSSNLVVSSPVAGELLASGHPDTAGSPLPQTPVAGAVQTIAAIPNHTHRPEQLHSQLRGYPPKSGLRRLCRQDACAPS